MILIYSKFSSKQKKDKKDSLIIKSTPKNESKENIVETDTSIQMSTIDLDENKKQE